MTNSYEDNQFQNCFPHHIPIKWKIWHGKIFATCWSIIKKKKMQAKRNWKISDLNSRFKIVIKSKHMDKFLLGNTTSSRLSGCTVDFRSLSVQPYYGFTIKGVMTLILFLFPFFVSLLNHLPFTSTFSPFPVFYPVL